MVEVSHNEHYLDFIGNDGNTPLTLSCMDDSKEGLSCVQKLIEYGVNINKADNEGNTPLNKACEFGNYDIVDFLITNSADINKVNDKGMTPLDTVYDTIYDTVYDTVYAGDNEHRNILDLLLTVNKKENPVQDHDPKPVNITFGSS